ncbi:sensor histidine kinase [Brevundimonas sp.]|uniref:sensor histidine kinase n=1 Tax=Brevundimonas sp. TaxID=1871086 RepID=UPI00289F1950|nr:sensor histidine kinase [Brevundimonas sp.]
MVEASINSSAGSRVSEPRDAGLLSAFVANEIKQSISAANIAAQAGLRWLDRASSDIEQARPCLVQIEDVTRQSADIMESLSTLATSASLDRSRASAVAIMEGVVEATRTEAAERDVSLYCAHSGDVLADMDPRLIKRALLNLTKNAFEALEQVPKDGRAVLLCLYCDEAELTFEVSDTGPGFSIEAASRASEPFVTSKPYGMGLGLSLCRAIAEAHGGALRIAGSPTSSGGRVSMVLPLHTRS